MYFSSVSDEWNRDLKTTKEIPVVFKYRNSVHVEVNVVHQQVLYALAEVLVKDVLLPPDVLDILGGAQSEENSLAQSSQDLRVDSGNVDGKTQEM
ncbi:hypothetical protein TNIN_191301 [Trichonephila inaurata madagascariensis]|uniref:Uncharacterized protein n=1 Tax=Trichonephila inaurata madagascariensis TaxID=2747483 RepID=A0A8X7CAK8_9ARAC|nr:hypothetical protein TNIN_191301 [Trichonephila inaurata madagascariensis]